MLSHSFIQGNTAHRACVCAGLLPFKRPTSRCTLRLRTGSSQVQHMCCRAERAARRVPRSFHQPAEHAAQVGQQVARAAAVLRDIALQARHPNTPPPHACHLCHLCSAYGVKSTHSTDALHSFQSGSLTSLHPSLVVCTRSLSAQQPNRQMQLPYLALLLTHLL